MAHGRLISWPLAVAVLAGLPGGAGAADARRGVANFRRPAMVVVDGHGQKTRIEGALVLENAKDQPLALKRLHFWGRSVEVPMPGPAPARPAASPGSPRSSGVLSVTVLAASPLRFAPDGSFEADVSACLHYPLLDEVLGRPPAPTRTLEDDDLDAFAEMMTGVLRGDFRHAIPETAPGSGKFRTRMRMEMRLATVNPLLVPIGIEFDIDFPLFFRFDFCFCDGWRLCIQPVGVKSFAKDPSPTGTAFEAQMDQARDVWSRVCVLFEVRDFLFVEEPDWKVITDGAAEEDDLRASVDVDDCIEVFFIDSWDPECANGGGVTSSGGKAGAKIVTADSNDNGIDFNHLAHELGHVLTLKHPGSGCPGAGCPDRADGNTGTVLCPSGFENDNPDVQSEENGMNVANPLLEAVFALCDDADCVEDADCGACGAVAACP